RSGPDGQDGEVVTGLVSGPGDEANGRCAVSPLVPNRFVRCCGRLFSCPCIRDFPSLRSVVDDEDQLVIVVAVEDLDVDACFGHAARDLTELARLTLIQSLDKHVALLQNTDSGG